MVTKPAPYLVKQTSSSFETCGLGRAGVEPEQKKKITCQEFDHSFRVHVDSSPPMVEGLNVWIPNLNPPLCVVGQIDSVAKFLSIAHLAGIFPCCQLVLLNLLTVTYLH